MTYNELNLTQHVNFPTHIHGNTLDLMLTFTDSKLLTNPLSDILYLLTIIPLTSPLQCHTLHLNEKQSHTETSTK